MAYKGRSERNLTGGYTHYDEKGRRAGRSEPGLFGGYVNYDAKGRRVGRSDPNLFGGGYTTYDAEGRRVGSSEPGFLGGYVHMDNKGKPTGHSDPGLTGYRHKDGACYVATCVYGSYDAPEVRALRRYRDQTLLHTWYGRGFVRLYYAASPWFVRHFGGIPWIRQMWRKWLDAIVAKLKG